MNVAAVQPNSHEQAPASELARDVFVGRERELEALRCGLGRSVAGRGGSVGDWRDAFIRMPYQSGTTVAMGAIFDTVESAITWERFADFHAGVMQATQKALDEICGGGLLSCRFTHVYPDGPAPYYTFLGLGKRGGEIEQWQALKGAGVPTSLVIYPGEGHGLSNPANAQDSTDRTVAWFEKYVGGGAR